MENTYKENKALLLSGHEPLESVCLCLCLSGGEEFIALHCITCQKNV